ncbi:class I adenylate-forming enzyme family protein [Pseudoxanthomonas mexicana]
MLLHAMFADTARRSPHRLALVYGDQRLDYAGLDAMSRRVASHLRRHGVAPGDRVGLLHDNSVEMVAAIWALLRMGAVCMPFNPQTKPDKLAGMLASTRAGLLIAQPSLASVWRTARTAAAASWQVVVSDPGWDGDAGEHPWPTPEAGDDGVPDAAPDDEALAFVSHTSGTTGTPKGVMLSHRNLSTVVRTVADYLSLRADDVIFSALPLSFNYGLGQCLLAFDVGATLVLDRSFAFPAKSLEILSRERATVFPAVPTMYAMLAGLSDLSPWDLSSLRLMTSASAPMPPALQQRMSERIPGADLVVMYGQTECTRISYLPPAERARRADSVGRGMAGQECWLIDDDGERVPWGGTGELVVQGEHVMRGYWEAPALTAEKFIDGGAGRPPAFRTGDLFRSDEDGWLYFLARKDDIIKTRGEKVSPVEVEAAIARLPGVRECLVAGVPDDLLGQAVKAWVVLQPGASLSERDVVRYCLAHLENHMAPRHVAFIDDLPRTDNGKPTRKGLS